MELEADLALVEWVLWLGAFILASFAFYLAQAIAYPVKHLPYIGGDFASAIEHYIADPVKKIADAAEKRLAKGLETLAGALELVGALAILLGYGIYKALGYLWHEALKPYVSAIVNPVRTLATEALTKLAALERTVAADLAAAEHYAEAEAAKALRDARTYAEGVALTAEHAAERYADEAVAKLRSAEDAAVASAVAIAHTAEHDAAAAFDHAKTFAEGLVAPVGKDVTALDNYVKGLDVPKIAAGAAATAALVATLVAETGLENAGCRAKIKDVCGTDPNVWGNLLGLLAPLGLALSLRELAAVANEIGPDLAKVLEQAG